MLNFVKFSIEWRCKAYWCSVMPYLGQVLKLTKAACDCYLVYWYRALLLLRRHPRRHSEAVEISLLKRKKQRRSEGATARLNLPFYTGTISRTVSPLYVYPGTRYDSYARKMPCQNTELSPVAQS